MDKEFVKKVLRDAKCRTQLVLVALCIVVCFVVTEFMADTKWANFIAIGCCMFSVLFCNEFARSVQQLRNDEEVN